MFDAIPTMTEHVKGGKVKALATTGSARSAILPDVPTLAEAGVPGYDVSPWFAVFAPAGTPRPVIDKLNAALLDAMKQPDVVTRLDAIGVEPVGSTPEALATHLASESARWTKLIAARGIKID